MRGAIDLAEAYERVRRAFAEFLAVPTLIIVGAVALAAVTWALDHAGDGGPAGPLRAFMRSHVFRDSKSTSDLLGTIAGGIITVTSITFSVLLLAVQQSAAALTNQVFDQFLRRRLNQVYLGSFVGLALYSLIVLASVDASYNPVYGASLALLLTVAALYLLIILIYSTIDQMRPTAIIEAIHDHTRSARSRQGGLLRATRRLPALDGPARLVVRVERVGFVDRIEAEPIARAIEQTGEAAEVVLLVPIGGYVAYGDAVAEIRAPGRHDLGPVAEAVRRAVRLERCRDLDRDPAYGVEQLLTIAWTSISTAKSNPAPGLQAIRSLRSLMARWTAEGGPGPDGADGGPPRPVVYRDDVPGCVLDALESLAVVSSESMQHQSLAEVLRTLSLLYVRLGAEERLRVEDILMRTLATLGDHAPTAVLDAALSAASDALGLAGRDEVASSIRLAHRQLASTVGRLNSRSTRASDGAPPSASAR